MKQKKLLILGGTRISLQILKAAKEMGLEVYVADYYEDSPCKKFADKSFMISATDVDAIENLIKKESIDGVLMGYADVLLPYYNTICNNAGLPCYSNERAISITTDKAEFKKYCNLYNIPTVQEYTVEDVQNGTVRFPVIVKPVDNSGARGIYICNNLTEFQNFYNKSLEFSRSKKVIIERLMTSGEATIFYYLHGGEVYLLGVADRWMYEQNKTLLKLPVGYTFPAKDIESFISNQDSNIKRMFKSLGMKEGMVFMQAFVENGIYVIYEMGYRLTGSIEHHLMDAVYGFNHLKKIICFAIGDEVDTSRLNELNPKDCNMANVTLLLKEGNISQIKGIDELSKLPFVKAFHVSYEEGESIDKSNMGRLSQVGVRVLLTAENRKGLLKYMNEVKNTIEILSDKGEDMVIRDYDYTQICQ